MKYLIEIVPLSIFADWYYTYRLDINYGKTRYLRMCPNRII